MSMFEGASPSIHGMPWEVFSYEGSPDQELDDVDTLATLRIKSNQLIKNNLIAAGAQQAQINSVGSPVKICFLQDAKKKPSKIQESQLNSLLEDTLESCDITGLKNMHNIVEEIVSWSFAHGDILISLPLDKTRSGVQTVVELIEASRIKTPNELRKDKDVRLGVHYYKDGRVKGYWVKKADKMDIYSDSQANFDFYPMYREAEGVKRKVTYLFKAPLNPRPKLSRQYPVLTPAMNRFKMLRDYEEAVIVGARVAACFSAFVLTGNPAAAQRSILESEPTKASRSTVKDELGGKVSKLRPGMVSFLKKDAQDVKFAAPNLPGDNVDKFRMREYKLLSMYLRMPYEILFLDLSESNYSSWKGASLEAKRMISRWRRDLDRFIRLYSMTIATEGILKGLVRGDLENVKVKVRWPVSGFLDPEKESRSHRIRIENKTASPQQICEEEGNDYDDVQNELDTHALREKEREAKVIARAKELEKEYGIIFPENENNPKELKEGERKTKLRPNEEGDEKGKPTEEEKRERRRRDGNW